MRPAILLSSIALATTGLASLVAVAATPTPAPARAPVPTRAASMPAPVASVASSTASAAPAAGPSAPLVDACPAQLAVKQTVSEAVAGWTPLNQQGSYPFVRVAFYPGPPVDSSLIVPTQEFKGQSGLHDTWDLPHRDGGYWMTCAYGNTTATVARKLPDDTDHCRADYDPRFITLVVKHWSCGVKRTMPPLSWWRPPARVPAKPAPKPTIKRVE